MAAPFIARTDGDGVQSVSNASLLTADLNASDLTASIQYDVFQIGNTIIIDQEHMLLTTRSTTLTFAARGADSTVAAAHLLGSRVREKLGNTILSHTFDGATWLNQISVGADVEFMYAVEVDGVRSRPRLLSTSLLLHDDFPLPRYKPAAGVVMKVVAWTWVTGNIWAELS